MVEVVLDLFFPRQCLGCGLIGSWVCERCLAGLEGVWREYPDSGLAQVAYYLYPFSNVLVQRAVHSLKYEGIGAPAEEIVRAGQASLPCQAGLVVPVPISPERWRERGYNQAQRLATALFGPSVVRTDLLGKISGESVVGKNREDRERAAARVFQVYPGATLQGEPVILVDDVITTGSTIRACTDRLLELGAGSVTVVALAHEE